MKIEFCLQELIKKHNINSYGLQRKLAEKTKKHTQTIAKIVNNQASALSVETLEIICEWLVDNGVPAKDLPQALFKQTSYGLFDALTHKKNMIVYLGESCQQSPDKGPAIRWISRRDAQVENLIVKELSRQSAPLTIETRYVSATFKYHPEMNYEAEAAKDIENSRVLYQDMAGRVDQSAMVLIGSQRANYLVEHYIANMFHCRPFQPTANPGEEVPFYIRFRSKDPNLASVFGGAELPGGYDEDTDEAGILFRNTENKWVFWPWEEKKQYVALAIVEYTPGPQNIVVCLFGFSGMATELVGECLVRQEIDGLWPPRIQIKKKKYSIVLCKFTVPEGFDLENNKDFNLIDKEFVSLNHEIVKNHMKTNK